jgi:uncharacterized protein (DUF486 family)
MTGYILPITLLIVSNAFMTFAWYGHLKFPHTALWIAILISWGIAFVEYCFAVPANRLGAVKYSLVELKTIQEVVSLLVFSIIAILFFGEKITLNHAIGFSLIAVGAYFIFSTKTA